MLIILSDFLYANYIQVLYLVTKERMMECQLSGIGFQHEDTVKVTHNYFP